MYREAVALRALCLLLFLPVTSSDQQRAAKTPAGDPSPYDYKIVLDASQPVAGHQILDIDALDFDDAGNFAILAFCADGVGIWASKPYAWVVFSGNAVTTAEGHQSKVRNVGPPSIGPDGSIRYQVDYQDGTPERGYTWKSGFFRDHTLIYEHDGYGVDTASKYTPDGKVLMLEEVKTADHKSRLSLWEGGPGNINQMPTDKLSSNVNLHRANALTVDRTTGFYAFFCALDTHSGVSQSGLFGNNTFINMNDVPDLGVWRIPLLINAQGRVAFTVGQRTIVDAKPSPYKGMLLAFNDKRDLLLQNEDTPADDPLVRDSINDMTVLQKGSVGRAGKTYLGLPSMPKYGFLGYFKHEALNNKREVAAAVQFVPQGKFESATTIDTRTIPTIDGKPNPWLVMIATPKSR